MHTNWRRLIGLAFQITFFAIIADIALKLMGFDFKSSLYKLFVSAWFIRAYVGLLILSPVLNSFVKNASKKQFLAVLVTFYTFQTIYGFIFTPGFANFVEDGYSTFSFIGLYLLARYFKIYVSQYTNYNARIYMFIFIAATLTITILSFVGTAVNKFPGQLYRYSSPFVIVQALSLLLFFNEFKFKSPKINKIALSSYAPYLLHSAFMNDIYKPTVLRIYDCDNPFVYKGCLVFLFVLGVYITAIILDRIRIFLWNKILHYYDTRGVKV